MRRRLQREHGRWKLASAQIKEGEEHRASLLREGSDAAGDDPNVSTARRLYELKGIGANSAWLFALEFFGWRGFRNGRQAIAEMRQALEEKRNRATATVKGCPERGG